MFCYVCLHVNQERQDVMDVEALSLPPNTKEKGKREMERDERAVGACE